MVRRAFLLLIISLALSSPAAANPYLPSFIEIITAPRAEAGTEIFFWVAVPAVFLLAVIETFAVRWKIRDRSFIRIYLSISIANFLTSVAGYYLIPSYSPVWSMVAAAFVSAVVLEWFVTVLLRGFGRRSIFGYSLLSLRMNMFSYAAISVALVWMLYAPMIGTEDRSVRNELQGRLVLGREPLEHRLKNRVRPYPRIPEGPGLLTSLGVKWVEATSADGKLICCRIARDWYIVELPSGKRVYKFPFKAPPEPAKKSLFDMPFTPIGDCAFTYNSQFFVYLCYQTDLFRVLDIKKSEVRNVGELVRWFSLSPVESKVVWTDGSDFISAHVYDCLKQKSTVFRIPWFIDYHDYLDWTPDGRYLSYATLGPSQWALDHRYYTIRAISIDGKRSATIRRRVPAAAGWYWQ